MSMQSPTNYLFDLKAENDAIAILKQLIFELKQGARSSCSLERAIDACETLYHVAQVPNHYLGMELIRLLSVQHSVSNQQIAELVNAFILNITAQIDFYRQSLGEP